MPRGLNEARLVDSTSYSGEMGASGGASRGKARPRPTRRSRGHIEKLSSGSLRVKVYAGQDALRRKPLYLYETVPAGLDAEERAEAVRARLVAQVATGVHPRSDATVAEMIDEYTAIADLGRKTRKGYEGNHRKHIKPLLGRFKINGGAVDAEMLDDFYGELARCRDHCSLPSIRHWTLRQHHCDGRCKPHTCVPLAAWTIRKIHFLLNSAWTRAVRKRWATSNPMEHAQPPPAPAAAPKPPTAAEAATIVDAAWQGTYYGRMVWVAMTTGARLGELCALRWRDLQVNHVDLAHLTDGHGGYDCLEQGCQWVLSISRSIEHLGMETWETDTKTHQHRRVAVDVETVAVLLDLRDVRDLDAKVSGRPVEEDDFIFHHPSGPDRSSRPGAVSTHYSRFVIKLGISTTFHKLRHYSATELITAGVDIRTVAGRLGHANGNTTLKIYAAWISEADQRASGIVAGRVPAHPAIGANPARTAPAVFEVVAERLKATITQGRVKPGEHLPTMKDLASAHRVSINAAHAAVNRLADWGYVTVGRGKRSTVADRSLWPRSENAANGGHGAGPGIDGHQAPPAVGADGPPSELAPVIGHIGATADRPAAASTGATPDEAAADQTEDGVDLLQLRLRCGTELVTTLCMEANLDDPRDVQRVVRDVGATLLGDLDDTMDGVLALDMAPFGSAEPVMTYVMGSVSTVRKRLLAVG